MTDNRIVYHGGKEIIMFPEIQTAKYNKDFYFGFYCTCIKEQAKFKRPMHQISFHTARALATLEFVRGYEVSNDDE